jgi:regulator of protease activity HflC (stomatin/prohibitin superfamily)
MAGLIVLIVLALLVLLTLSRGIRIVPQARAGVVERLGRYQRTLDPGLALVVPYMDRVRPLIDMREQVVSFPPQPVITEDNLTIQIDTVIYFQVTNAKDASYEIADFISAIEQLVLTTLRNVCGGMTLEATLTSRDTVSAALRIVLDEATGRWGIRINRVEIKSIDPPLSIQDSMERQMKADREKRAMILTAEGQREAAIKAAEGQKRAQILYAEGAKQAAILGAEAERQSQILRAQGDRAARYLQAQGQAKAIEKVFAAIKAGKPTPELLAYQYLQTLPQMAQGEANKVWLVPSDFGKALEGFTRMLGAPGEDGVFRYQPSPDDGPAPARPGDDDDDVAGWMDAVSDPEIARAVAEAEAEARRDIPPVEAGGRHLAPPPDFPAAPRLPPPPPAAYPPPPEAPHGPGAGNGGGPGLPGPRPQPEPPWN